MIALDVKRMRQATNNVFNKKLEKLHDELINNTEYDTLLQKATMFISDTGTRVFNSKYISTLAFISDEFTDTYVYDILYNNCELADNTMSSEVLTWEVSSIGSNTTLLNKLYILNRINEISHRDNANLLDLFTYESYIHISHKGGETGTVDLSHVGSCLLDNESFLGATITADKDIVLLSFLKDDISKKGKFNISYINGVIVMMDSNNEEIHMINANRWREYDKDHPFITIKEEWKLDE